MRKNSANYLGTEIGMVFQDCKAALCPVRTIGAQIHEAVSEHEKISKKEVTGTCRRDHEEDWSG